MDDVDSQAAAGLIEKIRRFVGQELDDPERALFARLLAPGVARVFSDAAPVDGVDFDDVEGFAVLDWAPERLATALASALRASGIRVVGLGE